VGLTDRNAQLMFPVRTMVKVSDVGDAGSMKIFSMCDTDEFVLLMHEFIAYERGT